MHLTDSCKVCCFHRILGFSKLSRFDGLFARKSESGPHVQVKSAFCCFENIRNFFFFSFKVGKNNSLPVKFSAAVSLNARRVFVFHSFQGTNCIVRSGPLTLYTTPPLLNIETEARFKEQEKKELLKKLKSPGLKMPS